MVSESTQQKDGVGAAPGVCGSGWAAQWHWHIHQSQQGPKGGVCGSRPLLQRLTNYLLLSDSEGTKWKKLNLRPAVWGYVLQEGIQTDKVNEVSRGRPYVGSSMVILFQDDVFLWNQNKTM